MNLILYLAFNFCIYGYLGWALENLFSCFVNGKMQEEGFLNSPFKPMYAFAMTMLIYFNKRIDNDFILLLLCLVIPTAVEFITGIIMRYYFNKDYWDYSKIKLNFKGIICLDFSLYWVLLSFFVLKTIQQFIIDNIYRIFSSALIVIVPLQIAIILIDFIMTIRKFNIQKKAI